MKNDFQGVRLLFGGPEMRLSTVWRDPRLWLGVMVALFVFVSLSSAVATFSNFAYANWNSANNTGIVTQAVASTALQHNAPFYESWDCMHTDRCSFMLIHTGFILYLAAPFYALAPSTLTLVGLQSFVLGAAAFPLYWLTLQVTRSTGKALFAAGLYLVWAPLFSAFTLHLEALLPLETLSLAAAWQASRYRWGFVAALAAFCTIEIAPLFIFLIGLFFLAPYLVKLVRRAWARIRSRGSAPKPTGRWGSGWIRSIRSALQDRRLRNTLILMASSVGAIVVLFSFRNLWGYAVLGVPQPTIPAGAGGLFYDGGATAGAGLSLTWSGFELVGLYWLIVLSLVCFLPFLAPRTLIISAPWICYTFFSHTQAFYTIGLEVTSVIAGPIFIGVAYGLARVPTRRRLLSDRRPHETEGAAVAVPSTARSPRRWRSTLVANGVVAVFATVVVANVLLSPINPALADLGYEPPPPFLAGYFDHNFTITPGLSWATGLVTQIPKSDSVAADSLLFPLVANYPEAFVMLPHSNFQPFANASRTANLPFNVSSGPDFVFIDLGFLKDLQHPFAANLSNPQEYGLRGYVSSTAIGPLLLFEQNYSSTALRYGPTLTPINSSYWPRSGITAGPNGRFKTNASAAEGIEVHSNPKPTISSAVWSGPGIFLTPGSYSIQFNVSVAVAGKVGLSVPVLGLVGVGFGPTLFNVTLPASMFSTGAWQTVIVNFTAPSPVPEFRFEGFQLNQNVTVAVSNETLQPIDPA